MKNVLDSSMPSLSTEEWHIYSAKRLVKKIKDKMCSSRRCNNR